MTSRIPVLATALAALALLLPVVAGAQQGAPLWDPEKVSALASQAVDALEALVSDPEIDAQQATAMQQREHEAAVATARELLELARNYRKRVDAGYDREETQVFWTQIELLRSDIQAYARRSWLPAETREKAERAVRLLDQLGSYYPES